MVVPYDEALAWIADGRIADGKTVILRAVGGAQPVRLSRSVRPTQP